MNGTPDDRPPARPLSVLFLIDSLAIGGAERSLAELAPALRAHGVVPTVLYLRGAGGRLAAELDEAGIDVRPLGESGLAGQVRAVHRQLVDGRPDLLHTTLFTADVVGRLAAVGTKVPVISTIASTPYEPERLADPALPPWRARVVKAVDGATARWLTDAFQAISITARSSAIRQLRISSQRTTVVLRGRDPERLGRPGAPRRRAARERLGLAPDAAVVLTVGRQVYAKGQRHLVEAMGLLRHEAVLLVAGPEGPASGEIRERRARLDRPESVHLLGERDDVAELMAAADVFVLPSIYEGLAGVLLEAMALGLPIVASDLPAVGEIVKGGENAVLVEPASAPALAHAIDGLLDDPETAASYGEASAAIFDRHFTVDRSAEALRRFYDDVAERGRRPRFAPGAVAQRARKKARSAALDYRYGGRSLRGWKASPFAAQGAKDTASSDYDTLAAIFRPGTIRTSDVVVDVGCGRGRVLNFWLSRRLPNQLVGIEIDPEIAEQTRRRLRRYPRVRIITGDAVEGLPADGTLYYLFNPFTEPVVAAFADRLAQIAGTTPDIRVLYHKPMHLSVFEDDPRWVVASRRPIETVASRFELAEIRPAAPPAGSGPVPG